MIATLRRVAVLALLAIAFPLAAQDPPPDRASVWVYLRNAQSYGLPGPEFRDMLVDVTVFAEIDTYDLDLRLRTPQGTLRCMNDAPLFPEEPLELSCTGVHPKPDVTAVTQVTVTWSPVGLFERPTYFRCRSVPLNHPGRVFGCDPR